MRKLIYCLMSVMVVVILVAFPIGVVRADNCELPVFNLTNFGSPQDNPYLSRDNIGYTYQYQAETDEGLIWDYIYFQPHPTKRILGVRTTVVYDVEYLWVEDLGEWRLLEETDDWHAWDNYGNFWYFGEDTVEHFYDDSWDPAGTSPEGSWEAGVDGAEPGIILPANPKKGECYYEEFYEDNAEDLARTQKLNAIVSWAYEDDEYGYGGECDNCGAFKEWTALDPGNVEFKYYAPGLGLVYIEELKEKTVIFELVDYFLGPPPATPPDPS